MNFGNDLQSKLKPKVKSVFEKSDSQDSNQSYKNQIFDEESLDDSLVRNIDTGSNIKERDVKKTSNCPIHGHDPMLKCKHDEEESKGNELEGYGR